MSFLFLAHPVYRKNQNSHVFFINNNISMYDISIKISVAETTVNKTIHAWEMSAPPIDSMNTVIRLNRIN